MNSWCGSHTNEDSATNNMLDIVYWPSAIFPFCHPFLSCINWLKGHCRPEVYCFILYSKMYPCTKTSRYSWVADYESTNANNKPKGCMKCV